MKELDIRIMDAVRKDITSHFPSMCVVNPNKDDLENQMVVAIFEGESSKDFYLKCGENVSTDFAIYVDPTGKYYATRTICTHGSFNPISGHVVPPDIEELDMSDNAHKLISKVIKDIADSIYKERIDDLKMSRDLFDASNTWEIEGISK